MNSLLATRLEGVSESITLKLNSMVVSMIKQGVDVKNLTAGEPDFAIVDEVKEAAILAIKNNKSKYTPAAGLFELRDAIARKTNLQQAQATRETPWTGDDVVVSNGGKQALFNSLLALLNRGDEVLIPSPYWLSYPEMVKLAEGNPVTLQSSFEEGFKLTAKKLASHSPQRVKALILNSPNNPTGTLYSKKEFQELGKVLESPGWENVWVISDEIYDRIILGDQPFCSFLEACPQLRARTVTINSMSKSAAMTGWRVGWSVAPKSLTQGISTLQGQSTSGVNSVAQWASIAALGLPDSRYFEQIQKYKQRRDIVLEKLSKNPKIEVFRPSGAFYVFAGIKAYLYDGEDSGGFAQRLLNRSQVAVVPGTPFGAPDFIRLSFATDEKVLMEACDRLLHFLELEGHDRRLGKDHSE